MTIDLYEIIKNAHNDWLTSKPKFKCGICKFIRNSISSNLYSIKFRNATFENFDRDLETIKLEIFMENRPPKHFWMLAKRGITPYCFGYYWKENDDFHREERFQQLLKHFKKPENRYLQL